MSLQTYTQISVYVINIPMKSSSMLYEYRMIYNCNVFDFSTICVNLCLSISTYISLLSKFYTTRIQILREYEYNKNTNTTKI